MPSESLPSCRHKFVEFAQVAQGWFTRVECFRSTRLVFGDRGIFVRRTAFEQLNGYRLGSQCLNRFCFHFLSAIWQCWTLLDIAVTVSASEWPILEDVDFVVASDLAWDHTTDHPGHGYTIMGRSWVDTMVIPWISRWSMVIQMVIYGDLRSCDLPGLAPRRFTSSPRRWPPRRGGCWKWGLCDSNCWDFAAQKVK